MVKFLFLITLLTVSSGSEKKTHPLTIDMQGVWESKTKVAGAEIRIVKTVGKDSETVEYFRGGQLVQKHTVDFEVNDEGPVTVFRWTNGRHLLGPRQGQPLADGTAVVRLVKGKLIFVEGMLNGDHRGVSVLAFTRVVANK